MFAQWVELSNFVKARYFWGLSVALVASFTAVRAGDTPAQAAARAALVQKMNNLDNPQILSSPGTPSGTAVAPPGESATSATNAIPAKTVTPQTASLKSTPVAAPAATPLTVAPAPAIQSVTAQTNTQSGGVPAAPKLNPALAQTKSSGTLVKGNPTNDIVTTDGTIYENALVERVEPDGIVISYTLPSGGVAMSRISFNDLPAALRQQYEKK